MSNGLQLPKYSVGVGDRFAHQAKAQLQACILAAQAASKSRRSGTNRIVSTRSSAPSHHPACSRRCCGQGARLDEALLLRCGPYPPHDGRSLSACVRFLHHRRCRLDRQTSGASRCRCLRQAARGVARRVPHRRHREAAHHHQRSPAWRCQKFLAAIQQAGVIYRKIESSKGEGNFIAEVSMDETDSPQTPAELLIILAAAADEGLPLATIAPKFSGRFNKGVDYVGDVRSLTANYVRCCRDCSRGQTIWPAAGTEAQRAFGQRQVFHLPSHSRDNHQIQCGVHLKTAGTTWLEELIGLAEAGGDGLALAKDIYAQAYQHREELCAPYASVIDIEPAKLPSPQEIERWDSERYTAALRHDPSNVCITTACVSCFM